jgi:hypothetical protein
VDGNKSSSSKPPCKQVLINSKPTQTAFVYLKVNGSRIDTSGHTVAGGLLRSVMGIGFLVSVNLGAGEVLKALLSV